MVPFEQVILKCLHVSLFLKNYVLCCKSASDSLKGMLSTVLSEDCASLKFSFLGKIADQ